MSTQARLELSEGDLATAPRQVRLESLVMRHFKGIEDIRLDFSTRGDSPCVFGANGAGKTTICDAVTWLLTGKDSAGRGDAEIKTLNPNGEPTRGLEHEARAQFKDGHGLLELSRTLSEKWTKKRGAATAEFTGHTTAYAIDGVPVSEAIFREEVRALFGSDDRALLLMLPTWFSEHLHWQERRRLLIEVCGDVDQAQIIAADPELRELPATLGTHTMDEHRAIVKQRMAAVNRELEQLPARLDEASRKATPGNGLPISRDEAQATIEQRIAHAEQTAAARRRELADLQAAGGAAQLRAQLQDAETLVRQWQTQRLEGVEATRRALAATLDALRREAREAAGGALSAAINARNLTAEAAAADVLLAERRAEWEAENANCMIPREDGATCAACGQPLPADQVEAAEREALARYNAEKARRLEEIGASGKRLAAEKKAVEERLAAACQQEREAEAKRAAAEARIAEVSQELTAVREPKPGREETAAIAERDRLKQELGRVGLDKAALREEAERRVKEAQDAVNALREEMAVAAASRAAAERVKELEARQRELGNEHERLSREIWLMDRFVRAKVDVLESRLNEHFSRVRFRMFDRLINGALEECCEATYQGVPWGDLNHAAKINSGLDIIRALGVHFGVQGPVLVDGRESVTELMPMPGHQVISFCVREGEASLRLAEEA
jgi:DNA repair exonuclease SbcCD ATPase subunit